MSGLRAVLIVASALWLAGAVATAPVAAQTPPQQPPSPAPAQPPSPSPPPAAEPPHEETQRPDSLKPGDAFGEKVDLTEQTIVYAAGSGQWDNAFPTIVNAFRQVTSYLQKQGIKPAGPAMTIYTSTNDTSFQFWAAIPVAEAPKDPPPGILVGHTTAGVAYKFVHRGSYDEMDTTYDAITNFLDEKQLDAKGLFIEQYDTDPLTTPEDKLVVEVFVPVK